MLKTLSCYIWRYKWTYVAIIVAFCLDYMNAIVSTRTIQDVVNLIQQGRLESGIFYGKLFFWFSWIIIFYLSERFWINRLYKKSYQFGIELRSRLFKRLLGMRQPYFQHFAAGDLLTRFRNDTENISNLIGYGLMTAVVGLITAFYLIPVMLMISVPITLFSILAIFASGLVIHYLSGYQEKVIEQERQSVADLSGHILEAIDGIRVTRAFASPASLKADFESKTKALETTSNKVTAIHVIYGRVFQIFFALASVIQLGMGAWAIGQGHLQIGDLVALNLYLMLLEFPMWVLSDLVLTYQQSRLSFTKIQELFEQGDEMEPDGLQKALAFESYSLRDYSFSYREGERKALSQVALDLEAGASLGIVGPTGSGKTTLLKQFLRLYPLGQGQALLNGQPLQDFERASVLDLVSYVPQEHQLFSASIRDNLLLAKPDAIDSDLLQVLEQAAFLKDLQDFEKGLDTLIGEKGVSLSGGQKQRLSIARALLKGAPLLLLDDCLSAVDAKTEKEILHRIRQEKDAATMLVSHRLSTVAHCDHILVLENGSIIQEGSHDHLLAKEGWYRDQYLLQARGDQDEND